MSVIFSELIEDYFLSNIKNNLFEDDNTEETEPVDESKLANLLNEITFLFLSRSCNRV